MADDRKILRAVRHNRKTYRTDDRKAPEALDAVLTPAEVERLKNSTPPAISGEFKGKGKGENKAAPTATSSTANSDELPAGIPGRMHLIKAGYDTRAKVNAAADADLTAIQGIGEETTKKIREALK